MVKVFYKSHDNCALPTLQAEEKKLEAAEKYLEESATMFDEFLKENDKNAVEAIKMYAAHEPTARMQCCMLQGDYREQPILLSVSVIGGWGVAWS